MGSVRVKQHSSLGHDEAAPAESAPPGLRRQAGSSPAAAGRRFGEENVNFDKNVRTQFCDTCLEITVESSGGAAEHQPNRLGTFTRDGSLWENMVPFWTADNKQHITPDPLSNPIIYYVKWVVSETVGGFNAGLMND